MDFDRIVRHELNRLQQKTHHCTASELLRRPSGFPNRIVTDRGTTVYYVRVDGQLSSTQVSGRPVWLSGAVLTLLNKVVFPVLWLAFVAGVPLWVFVTYGRISIGGGFEFIVAFVLVSTIVMVWMAVRLQRVGYCGRELVIANYWREAWVPFDQVAAVEPVWWYRSRLVRIRFKRRTPFGSCVYYLPKWGPVRALFAKPEEELKQLLRPEFK
jgi:hypothetical protein